MKSKKILLAFIVCVLAINIIPGITLLDIHAEDSTAIKEKVSNEIVDVKSLTADQLYKISGNSITGLQTSVDKTSIIELTIPNSINGAPILTIGGDAFKELPNLKKVIFEADAAKDEISRWAFQNCPNLEEVIIESSISKVGDNAFQDCKNLKTFPFQKITESMGYWAFNRCTSLTKVILSDTLSSTGENVFSECSNVTEVHIPENENYTKISNNFFSYLINISQVSIPSNITKIDRSAFKGCTKLTNVTIPNSITTIGQSAFEDSGLETLTLPGSITTFGIYAFNRCENLKSIVFEEGITGIGASAFINNRNLKEITFPTTLTSIESRAFMIDDFPHQSNQGLEKIYIPNNPNSQISINTNAFTYNSIKEFEFGNINKIMFVNNPFVGQMIPVKLYKTEEGYFLDFKQTGIKQYEKISLSLTSATEFTKVKNGVFKLNNPNVLPTKINYEYKLLDTVDISKVSGIDIVPSIEDVYTVVFKDINGVVKGKEYSLKDGNINFPNVEKEGFTTVWDSGVESGLRKVFTFTYKELPKLVGKSEVSIPLNTSFSAKDYFKFEDADGNEIDNTIFEGTVNTSKAGSYTLTYTTTDKWGGTSKGKIIIKVLDTSTSWRELIDPKTKVKVSGNISNEGRLVVEPLENNPLIKYINDKRIIVGSYEVKVIGNYTGKLIITFPIDKKYEGSNVYIKHQKQDGTITDFKRVVKDGGINIEVDELSPFILTVDKKDIKPNQPVTPNNKVDTSDTTRAGMYFLMILFSVGIIGVITKKKSKQ